MFLAVISMFILFTGVPADTEGTFSDREAALINSAGADGMMKVFNTENPADLPVLREICREVGPEIITSPLFKQLMEGMLATVNDPENTGVGIAAPQVGVACRIIAVQRFDQQDEPFGFYLNPRIVAASSETVESPEGCLSIPDTRGYVSRHAAITIEYNDPEDFSLCQEELSGFTAIIFQHEIDHLDGILFTDKIIETDGEI
ncbi:MAG: peptide deformylase [Alistipes sp.]|nr:peptide deformylase [Alistipes sp.]